MLNIISYLFGLISSIYLPRFLRPFACNVYAKLTGADLFEVELDLREYSSINKFFTRSLKGGLRPIKAKFSAPADSELRLTAEIKEDLQPQVKGKVYSLSELIEEPLDGFIGGQIWNFYLSPKDYHHVHSPVAGEISSVKYLPGCLWPVNNFSFARVNNLFAVNERLVFNLETEYGRVCLVMVGACNVGKMTIEGNPLSTNQLFSSKESQGVILNKQVLAGERIGTFNLGSSVVLLTEKKVKDHLNFLEDLSGQIKLGESLTSG